MDCRRPLFVGLVLMSLGTGCVGLGGRREIVARTAPTGPPVAATASAAPAPARKRTPLPGTCVAFAVHREREAAKLDHEPRVQRDMRDEARRAYQEALRLDPKFLPAHAGLGRLYTQIGDYDRAQETFKKAIEKLPKEPSLWFDLGMCHCRRKDWPSAAQALQTALDLDPENRHMQQTLGFTLARGGKIDEGLNHLTKAVGAAEAHYNVARMLLHLQRPDEARGHLEEALRANPRLGAAQQLLTSLTTTPQTTPPNLIALDITFDPPLPLPPPQ